MVGARLSFRVSCSPLNMTIPMPGYLKETSGQSLKILFYLQITEAADTVTPSLTLAAHLSPLPVTGCLPVSRLFLGPELFA